MRATTAVVREGRLVVDVPEFSDGTPVKLFLLPERFDEKQIDELAWMLVATDVGIDQAESTINAVRSLAGESAHTEMRLELGSVSEGRVTIQTHEIPDGARLIIVMIADRPVRLSPEELEELEAISAECDANPDACVDGEELLAELREGRPPGEPFTAAQLFRRFSRITRNADVLDGKPCIQSVPVSVGTILSLLDENVSETEIGERYPGLQLEDIREAVDYARAGHYVDGEGIEEFPPDEK
jgi:uncharacterized protein (DUF433 family)